MKIANQCLQADSKGNPFILCTLQDGSQWSCDITGSDWKKVSLSSQELESKLNAFLAAEAKTFAEAPDADAVASVTSSTTVK